MLRLRGGPGVLSTGLEVRGSVTGAGVIRWFMGWAARPGRQLGSHTAGFSWGLGGHGGIFSKEGAEAGVHF